MEIAFTPGQTLQAFGGLLVRVYPIPLKDIETPNGESLILANAVAEVVESPEGDPAKVGEFYYAYLLLALTDKPELVVYLPFHVDSPDFYFKAPKRKYGRR